MASDFSPGAELTGLKKKLTEHVLPPELLAQVEGRVERLSRLAGSGVYSGEYANTARYIDWVTNLPWDVKTADNLDLANAKKILDKNHYGMTRIKDRLLEYISVLNLNKGRVSAGTLCFVGLPGIGKTSVAVSIAEALNRRFVRIAMGGMGDVAQLRGLPPYLPGSEPGLIIKNLRRVGSNNPVILLDEIDRVAESGRAAIMGALLELLDPEQNNAFNDYFIDYPIDLSEVLFVASANNTGGISNAVLDRLEVIEMPSYSDNEKKVIGRDYLFPKALREAGLAPAQITISDELWPKIIRPLGYDAGIRTLDRTINGICRKTARKIVESGVRNTQFVLTDANIKDFLPTW